MHVQDTTDHAKSARQPVRPQKRQIDFADKLPQLRRARCVYAYAQGLHMRLHYPQQFLVTLNGEPAVKNDWTVSPCMVSGHAPAASALKHAVNVVANRDVNPKSMCNHVGCIYNQGDLITRRARFLTAIKEIDDILDKPASSSAYLITHSACNDIIIDSGAGRHIHNHSSHFSTVRPCTPQTLTGFTGKKLTISTCGQVGNFTNVLLVPTAHASVRSVSAALDARGGKFIFTASAVTYEAPDGKATTIGHRTSYGLYALNAGAMPPPQRCVPTYIAAPIQVRRESIHRLHQSLAHAGIERMRYAIKNCPTIAGSLTTRDLALFTTCPACQVGKCRSARAPKSTPTRSTLVGYRLHADTTGVIRPSTQGGFVRALIVVDDASRWIFVQLLQTVTMEEMCTKFEIILRDVASGAHILPTRVVRSDNGTEFLNSAMSTLFTRAGIQHERTCPHTSHQNGVAERAIGKIMPVVRTMIADASANPTFWGEAMMAATHVVNRMPTTTNANNMSPYQVRFNRVPSIAHFQPWGITAYVRRNSQQTKVMPRADAGMFVGYGHDVTKQKGWRVYLPHKRTVVTSTSVAFHRSLSESVQQRPSSLRSTSLPVQHNVAQPLATPYPLPPVSSITAPVTPPPPPASPVPHSAASVVTPPAPQNHPICQRATTGPTISPQVAQQQHATTRRITRSMARENSRPASWSDVVTKADEDIQSAQPASRPPGRPPKNHNWDPRKGQYVPINIVKTPSLNRAWVLTAVNSDLVSDHKTPTTYEEAISGPDSAHWIKAIQSELQSLRSCAVWKLVVLSAVSRKAKPIPTKWVFKRRWRRKCGQIQGQACRLRIPPKVWTGLRSYFRACCARRFNQARPLLVRRLRTSSPSV